MVVFDALLTQVLSQPPKGHFYKVKPSLVSAVSKKRFFQPNVLAVGRYKEQIKNKHSIVDKNGVILQRCINS